jgi:hypothetical protein
MTYANFECFLLTQIDKEHIGNRDLRLCIICFVAWIVSALSGETDWIFTFSNLCSTAGLESLEALVLPISSAYSTFVCP